MSLNRQHCIYGWFNTSVSRVCTIMCEAIGFVRRLVMGRACTWSDHDRSDVYGVTCRTRMSRRRWSRVEMHA